MKGPGLPGFRKKQGTAFYKMNPFNSKRSPIKENGNEGWKEGEKSAQERAEERWQELRRQGVKEEDINWDEIVVEENTVERNNQTITTTKEGQFGYLEREVTDFMPDEKWREFVEKNPNWREKDKVYRGSEKIDT